MLNILKHQRARPSYFFYSICFKICDVNNNYPKKWEENGAYKAHGMPFEKYSR